MTTAQPGDAGSGRRWVIVWTDPLIELLSLLARTWYPDDLNDVVAALGPEAVRAWDKHKQEQP